jgi:pyruvyl transferase EpsO
MMEQTFYGDPMPKTASCAEIRATLDEALAPLGRFAECALLDYPYYFNVGDHLIWLGAVSWLHKNGVAIRHAAGQLDFAQRLLEAKAPEGPLVFTGGGNFGDLWPDHQNFREHVIARNRRRAVWILPQSVYFRSPQNLERAKRVIGSHPDITICLRDEVSFRTATQHFGSARLIYAPDMAFELCEFLKPPDEYAPAAGRAVLYLSRTDQEFDSEPLWDAAHGIRVDQSDWFNMGRREQWALRLSRRLPRPVKRGALLHALPQAVSRESQEPCWSGEGGFFHARSLGFLRRAVSQFLPYGAVVTNRLHGHVLSCLIGKPNVLLPNSYHKNAAFFASWTRDLPRSHFAAEPRAVSDCLASIFSGKALPARVQTPAE